MLSGRVSAHVDEGWRVDSQYYHVRIEQVLDSMVDAQADALPANRRCIAIYLNSYVIDGALLRPSFDEGIYTVDRY